MMRVMRKILKRKVCIVMALLVDSVVVVVVVVVVVDAWNCIICIFIHKICHFFLLQKRLKKVTICDKIFTI